MDEKIKILLAEDDTNLGMLLKEYLRAKGFDTILCEDGDAAYEAFLNQPFALWIFDVMMPKRDGFTLAKDVRQINSEIPIIFLTAKNMKEDVLEGFKIGADDYMSKPFSMEALLLLSLIHIWVANPALQNEDTAWKIEKNNLSGRMCCGISWIWL